MIKTDHNHAIKILLIATIVSLFYHFFSPYRNSIPKLDLVIGQVADRDIIAPFSFTVYKTDEQLKEEKKVIEVTIDPTYKISENLNFNSMKNLDFLFHLLNNFYLENENLKSIQKELKKKGYLLTIGTIEYLSNESDRNEIYRFLIEEISKKMSIGIYSEDYPENKIKLYRNNSSKIYMLRQLYSFNEAIEKIVELVNGSNKKKCVKEITEIIIQENIIIDTNRTDDEISQATSFVSRILYQISTNEKIISKNQKITEIEMLKLEEMLKKQSQQGAITNKNKLYVSTFGFFLLLIVLLFFLFDTIRVNFPEINKSNASMNTIALIFGITSIVFLIIIDLDSVPNYFLPVCFAPIFIAVVFEPKLGMIYNIVNLFLISFLAGLSLKISVPMTLATMYGQMNMEKLKDKHSFLPTSIKIVFAHFIVFSGISLLHFQHYDLWSSSLLFGSLSIIISVFLATSFSPFVEKQLKLTTRQNLLELLDLENPLMKSLMKNSQGTYSHSLIVGNLAESAADAIGANALLARVGSYYHDIGKIEDSEIFIENNSLSTEIHNKMKPLESAAKIREHVTRGIFFAKRYKLPQSVIDIIKQHHGDGKIKYFLNKAKRMGLEVQESQFAYYGPKPQTKEAALVMIADIIESTAKSLSDFSEQAIKNVIDSTIERLINEKQLSESPLTIRELETIKSYMLPILMGVYRKRIVYPTTDDSKK